MKYIVIALFLLTSNVYSDILLQDSVKQIKNDVAYEINSTFGDSVSIVKIEKKSDNILKIVLKSELLRNRGKKSVVYYSLVDKFLFIGSLFKDGVNYTKRDLAEARTDLNISKVMDLKDSNSSDNNITSQLHKVKGLLSKGKKELLDERIKLAKKYSNDPIKLLKSVKGSKYLIFLNSGGKRGQVLVILNTGCNGCKRSIELGMFERLIDADFEIALLFPYLGANEIDDKKAFLLSSMDSNLSDKEVISRIKETINMQQEFNISKKQKASFEEFKKKTKVIVDEHLINGFPAVIVVGLAGKDFNLKEKE